MLFFDGMPSKKSRKGIISIFRWKPHPTPGPAHLADMHPQEIDQAFLDQQAPFAWIVKQLAHRDGGGTLLEDVAESFNICGGQRIFQEEQVERFDIFGKLDRVDRRQAFVNIVQQFHFFADVAADEFDHFQHTARIGARVEIAAIQRPWGFMEVGAPAAVAAHLNADVAVALFLKFEDIFEHFLRIASIGMGVDGGPFAALTPEQVVDRHISQLALNILQGLVDPRYGVVKDRAIAPVALHQVHLEKLLDAGNILTQHKRLNMALQGRVNSRAALGEGGAAQAIQTRLGGQHFDDDNPAVWTRKVCTSRMVMVIGFLLKLKVRR